MSVSEALGIDNGLTLCDNFHVGDHLIHIRESGGVSMDSERLELLVQIATWYYEENLSQEDVVGRVGLSRSMVSPIVQKGGAADHTS